ncbi:hypothetical protein DRQ25_08090 [Candidatus Fermentibacteria bacterium]|nr:MAG: hypothetical protein DRQ25_08090 [Candidatus Fermentibacteria bacterium]
MIFFCPLWACGAFFFLTSQKYTLASIIILDIFATEPSFFVSFCGDAKKKAAGRLKISDKPMRISAVTERHADTTPHGPGGLRAGSEGWQQAGRVMGNELGKRGLCCTGLNPGYFVCFMLFMGFGIDWVLNSLSMTGGCI